MTHQIFQLTDSEIQRLVTLGGLAPSGGNIQPWRVVATSQTLEIYLDPVRSTSLIDVERYASIFSLGSFAENVSIASDTMGLVHNFKFIGYQSIESPLARFEYSDRKNASMTDPSPPLYASIEKRVTNRKPFDGAFIEPGTIATLQVVVQDYDDGLCHLHALSSEGDKRTAARILGKADRIRMFNQELHKQMFGEIRWNAEEVEKTQDGIDVTTLELPPEIVQQLSALRSYEFLRSSVPPQAIEALAEPAILACSHFCCLTIKGDINPMTLFTAGRILQRLWLKVTKWDLALQPWTVLPFFLIRATFFPGTGFNEAEESEIRELGEELRMLFALPNEVYPLFLFRLSKAGAPSARSLRLAWNTFTEIQR